MDTLILPPPRLRTLRKTSGVYQETLKKLGQS